MRRGTLYITHATKKSYASHILFVCIKLILYCTQKHLLSGTFDVPKMMTVCKLHSYTLKINQSWISNCMNSLKTSAIEIVPERFGCIMRKLHGESVIAVAENPKDT